MSDPRRRIPSVDRLLAADAFAPLAAAAPRPLLLRALRDVQDVVRAGMDPPPVSPEWYAERTRARLDDLLRPSLRPLINATGVVLHTNLGRAPLAAAALDAMAAAAGGYATLEYDLDAGERGSRDAGCRALLMELTGAEDALVVNNNAAAVLLALNTLAAGREAVISRGELVEIGGSFRVPEIMARSGAAMVEVGATNRTHAADYQAALSPRTGAVLKVHRSNFRMEGFIAEVGADALAALCAAHGVPLLHDVGSGLLVDAARLGLPAEPTLRDAVAAGADVVSASGDKALGGPQAGLLLGRAALIDAMRRSPLRRALRPDKLTLAALEATLRLYRDPEVALREVPVLRMLALSADALETRARALCARLADRGVSARVVSGASAVGGGAFPGATLPTALVRIEGRDAAGLERGLRAGDPPVIARVRADGLELDLRTVSEAEEPALVDALGAAARP